MYININIDGINELEEALADVELKTRELRDSIVRLLEIRLEMNAKMNQQTVQTVG